MSTFVTTAANIGPRASSLGDLLSTTTQRDQVRFRLENTIEQARRHARSQPILNVPMPASQSHSETNYSTREGGYSTVHAPPTSRMSLRTSSPSLSVTSATSTVAPTTVTMAESTVESESETSSVAPAPPRTLLESQRSASMPMQTTRNSSLLKSVVTAGRVSQRLKRQVSASSVPTSTISPSPLRQTTRLKGDNGSTTSSLSTSQQDPVAASASKTLLQIQSQMQSYQDKLEELYTRMQQVQVTEKNTAGVHESVQTSQLNLSMQANNNQNKSSSLESLQNNANNANNAPLQQPVSAPIAPQIQPVPHVQPIMNSTFQQPIPTFQQPAPTFQQSVPTFQPFNEPIHAPPVYMQPISQTFNRVPSPGIRYYPVQTAPQPLSQHSITPSMDSSSLSTLLQATRDALQRTHHSLSSDLTTLRSQYRHRLAKKEAQHLVQCDSLVTQCEQVCQQWQQQAQQAQEKAMRAHQEATHWSTAYHQQKHKLKRVEKKRQQDQKTLVTLKQVSTQLQQEQERQHQLLQQTMDRMAQEWQREKTNLLQEKESETVAAREKWQRVKTHAKKREKQWQKKWQQWQQRVSQKAVEQVERERLEHRHKVKEETHKVSQQLANVVQLVRQATQ